MKRINIGIDGGFPITLDDLAFMEDSQIENAVSIVKGLIGDYTAAILFGGEISVLNSGGGSPILNVTSGAMYYSNEIFQIDSYSLALASGTTLQNILDNYKWDLSVTTDTPVTYENSTVNNAYKYNKAVLVAFPSTWVDIEAGIPNVNDIITPDYATESSEGVVRLSTSTEVKDGATETVLTTTDFSNYENLLVTAYTGNNAYTTVSNASGRYKKMGNLVFSTGKFTLTANIILSSFIDFDIQTNIVDAFSDIIYGSDGVYTRVPNFSFNIRRTGSEGQVDYAVAIRKLNNTVYSVFRLDGVNWTYGDSVDVQYQCFYIKN